MRKKFMKKLILPIIFILLFQMGCSNLLTSEEPNNYKAPSRNYTLKEIFDYQNIKSIQFHFYDSLSANDESVKYKESYDIYYDLNRTRNILYIDNEPVSIFVKDIKKNISWSYEFDTHILNTTTVDSRIVFDNLAKNYLCTHLTNDIIQKNDTTINKMNCNVFQDSSNTKEWIWNEHRIPIQYEKVFSNPEVISTKIYKMSNIQINIELSDSLFEYSYYK
jgi:outer membrane lipoprotein-sorting protein